MHVFIFKLSSCLITYNNRVCLQNCSYESLQSQNVHILIPELATTFSLILHNLYISQYAGVWYEVASIPNEHNKIKSCLLSRYSTTEEGMAVVSSGKNEEGNPSKNKATLTIPDKTNPAHMVTNFVPLGMSIRFVLLHY